ncbi:MAG: hypothetical protein ABFD92_00150 [Planctomycetaceae bacterium]|nr:hypothetical protein [Planctomycetaceae bacterium]
MAVFIMISHAAMYRIAARDVYRLAVGRHQVLIKAVVCFDEYNIAPRVLACTSLHFVVLFTALRGNYRTAPLVAAGNQRPNDCKILLNR